MSLINEALKRTHASASLGQPATGQPLPAPLHSGPSPASRPGHRPRAWQIVAVAVLVLGLGAAAFGYWHTQRGSTVTDIVNDPQIAPAPVVPVQTVTAPQATGLAGAADPALVERIVAAIQLEQQQQQVQLQHQPDTVATATAVPVAGDQPAEPAAPEPVPPPPPPSFKLQGIMRDGSSIAAMINGYTVAVGDRVDGYVVRSINEGVVQLESGDHTVELRMR